MKLHPRPGRLIDEVTDASRLVARQVVRSSSPCGHPDAVDHEDLRAARWSAADPAPRPGLGRSRHGGDEATTGQMGRGALEATMDIDGTAVTVVAAHFKSKLISYLCQAGVVEGPQFAPNEEGERLRYAVYLRAAEAMTIRAHLDGLLANPDDLARASAAAPRSVPEDIVVGRRGSRVGGSRFGRLESVLGGGIPGRRDDAGFNVFIHALGKAGVFVLPLVPTLERWVESHVMSGR